MRYSTRRAAATSAVSITACAAAAAPAPGVPCAIPVSTLKADSRACRRRWPATVAARRAIAAELRRAVEPDSAPGDADVEDQQPQPGTELRSQFERGLQGIHRGVLGDLPVAELADQRRDHAPVLAAVRTLDGASCRLRRGQGASGSCMIGRTSIEP